MQDNGTNQMVQREKGRAVKNREREQNTSVQYIKGVKRNQIIIGTEPYESAQKH